MIAENLGSLFSPDPSMPAAMALRQGIVQSWDPDTGENTVQVAGGTLANVPALVSESVALVAGDVVALLTTGDRWLLVGKVITPGDPGTVPSWPTDITALETSVNTVTTVTIPAVQADVTTAQTTADTAAADATTALSKFPITETEISDGAISTPKLQADAIDGMVITGAVIRTAATGPRVDINETFAGEMAFTTDRATEVTAGRIGPQWTLDSSLTTTVDSPVHSAVSSGLPAEIVLETTGGGFRNVWVNADRLVISDVDPKVFVRTDWTALTLVNSWVDVAGGRAHYSKDQGGRVQLRGLVISGASSGSLPICTLPTGHRPGQTMEWIMRGGSGVIMCAIQILATGVMTVVANASTASSSGVRLDSITFPTF